MNREALERIERAVLFVSLDDELPADIHARAASLLHGDGTNRWFGKPSLTAL